MYLSGWGQQVAFDSVPTQTVGGSFFLEEKSKLQVCTWGGTIFAVSSFGTEAFTFTPKQSSKLILFKTRYKGVESKQQYLHVAEGMALLRDRLCLITCLWLVIFSYSLHKCNSLSTESQPCKPLKACLGEYGCNACVTVELSFSEPPPLLP